MPIDDELLGILCFPETRQPVSRASDGLIEPVNAEIAAGRQRTRGGGTVEKPITEALVREDGRVLYVVDEGIPIMLIDQSIELS